MKTYVVFVEWKDSAEVIVHAEDELQAKRRALDLVENGQAHYPIEDSAGNFEATKAQEIKGELSPEEAEYLRQNDEELEANDDPQLPESL